MTNDIESPLVSSLRELIKFNQDVGSGNIVYCQHLHRRICDDGITALSTYEAKISKEKKAIAEEAEFILNGELYALIKLRDEMPTGSFSPHDYRQWQIKKDQALERFWGLIVHRRTPFRAFLTEQKTPRQ